MSAGSDFLTAVMAVLLLPSAARGFSAQSIARQDLWTNPACQHSPKPANGEPYTSTMLDFNEVVERNIKESRPQPARDEIATAYAYANAHCIPLRLGDADLQLDRGKFKLAFSIYRDKFFPDGGLSFTTLYVDLGAADPLRAGLEAASIGDDVRAEAEFRRSIAKAPDFQQAHFMLGNLLFSRRRLPEARQQWLAVLSSYGDVVPEKESFGPDQPWLSALRMYEIHRSI